MCLAFLFAGWGGVWPGALPRLGPRLGRSWPGIGLAVCAMIVPRAPRWCGQRYARAPFQGQCTRMCVMEKMRHILEELRAPVLAFTAVVLSIVVFLIGLYLITILIRLLFAGGQ